MTTDYPTIKVKLDKGAYMPERAHDTDAGADIRCRERFTVKAHGFMAIDTGVHIELPPTTKCEIKSKSGLWTNHGILTTGLIDEGFSGTIRVGLANLSDQDYTFEAGEKVTQLCVSHVCYPTYVEASEVKSGKRGNAGYGSTGRL
jgi:dUTP pyrophosphatase